MTFFFEMGEHHIQESKLLCNHEIFFMLGGCIGTCRQFLYIVLQSWNVSPIEYRGKIDYLDVGLA
jgi:hypothetical protein